MAAFLYKYRYFIAFAIFALCVALGLTGSSIGMWCTYFGVPDNDVLLGVSRPIRSDEWALFTPLAFSQYANGFGYFSDIARGCPTDVFMEYGQAVLDPLVVFRPFFWGYLFLPVANGMAFFWCGRLIALFLVSFEFAMLVAGRRKDLSLAFASLTAFAPAVQWWFAINGLVEMLVFSMLSVMALRRYMLDASFWRRTGCLAVIVVCAGGFALTLYPSWMMPMAYQLAGLAIWVFIENFRDCRMERRDWVSVAVAFLVFAAAMARFYLKSRPAIEAIVNTVYPGVRFEMGGGMLKNLFVSVANVWYAHKEGFLFGNSCESSYVIDFFPVCLILPVAVMARRKRLDPLLCILLAVWLFLGAYCVFGFPAALSKITLLSKCQAGRVVVPLGFCNLILLVRALALCEKPLCGIRTVLVLALLSAGTSVFVCRLFNPEYLGKLAFPLTLSLFTVLNACLLRCGKVAKTVWCVLSIVALFYAGALVNPVRRGVDSVRNIPVVKALREISGADKGAKWIFEGCFPFPNIMLVAGVPCVNSTNIYPDLERWRLLDPGGACEDAYNRYAHINVKLSRAEPAKFVSPSPDQLNIELSPAALRKIGVKYVATGIDHPEFVGSGDFRLVETCGPFKFYEVVAL